MSQELQPRFGPIAPAHRFDVAKLSDYLAQRLGLAGATLDVAQFQGGASNPTFLLTFATKPASTRFVMRKQPPGPILPSAHQVDREFRVMKALADTDVPVPRMQLFCEDRGIIGTAFYVMDYIEGRILTDPYLPGLAPEARAAIYDSFGDTLAKLHNVDVKAVGLGDFGREGDFIERQLGRFTKQYRAAELEQIADMEELIRVLPQSVPGGRRVGIVHGDFKLGNVIVHPRESRVVAVLDWELATIGDPLADLAFSALHWHRVATDGTRPDWSGAGLPSEHDYLRAYMRRTGRARIEGWNFYLALALFRLASIMQGVYRRVLSGTVASNFEAVNMAPDLARQALTALREADAVVEL